MAFLDKIWWWFIGVFALRCPGVTWLQYALGYGGAPYMVGERERATCGILRIVRIYQDSEQTIRRNSVGFE